jgi:serine/threonine protein kinase
MNPEQWREIKRIFGEAEKLSSHAQREFVRVSTGGDEELEEEVLRLLRANTSTGGFLEEPVADLHRYMMPGRDEPVLRVGIVYAKRFEVLRFLSQGGMGEVYEAWDGELNESVALKTIRPQISSNIEVIERFKREVKQAREVSHPNICRVHELFSHHLEDGQVVWFLSMELLLGDTLLERIRANGPLSPALALSVTKQMVSALSAAHTVGLVHRDFKSSNVILIPESAGRTRAVITDFGLSLRKRGGGKLPEPGGMGTPGYMAPEQELDGDVGPLADQYSLGVVMCEMLTGSQPCWSSPKGNTEKEALELPYHRLPPRWESVLRRCLQRDPRHRFATIEDVSVALAPPGVLGTPRRIAVAVLLLGSAVGGGVLRLRDRNRCRICDVVQLTPDTDESESPSLSKDGHEIVYSSDRADTGNLDIFFQKLPGGQAVRLTRDTSRDDDPSISPDGTAVVFRSERDGGGIYLKDVRGGREVMLIPRGRNPRISPDGQSVLYWTGDPDPSVASGRVFLIPLRGGEPVEIAKSFQDARLPIWSPDGRAISFLGCSIADKPLPGCLEWWIASLDGRKIVKSHVLERLHSAGILMSQAVGTFWYKDGLVLSGGPKGLQANLWTIKVDSQRWTATGSPKQLLREEARDLSPTIANDGSIAFTRISGALHIWRIDREISPANTVLSKITDDAQIDNSPFISASEILLVTPGIPSQSPIVDKTGQLLAYEQTDLSNEGTSICTRVGESPVRRLCQGCSAPSGWFNSDQAFFYRDGMPSIIKMADPRTGATRIVLQEDGAALSDASWSPVNELMLFIETKGDRKQMFAVRLPRATANVEGRWIPIPDKGITVEHPRWSGDGRTIFYSSNSDGFTCIYGQAFSPEKGAVVGKPFSVAHFHNGRASIDNVFPRARTLSVDGNSIYFNLGEQLSTIWIGSVRGH